MRQASVLSLQAQRSAAINHTPAAISVTQQMTCQLELNNGDILVECKVLTCCSRQFRIVQALCASFPNGC
jgi:hypothetical protein